MELLKETKHQGIEVTDAKAKVHCKAFEGNSGALEMAKVPKHWPRTKHVNVKLHHFRDCVEREEISIHPVGTEAQSADCLAKPVNLEILQRLRAQVLGW